MTALNHVTVIGVSACAVLISYIKRSLNYSSFCLDFGVHYITLLHHYYG
jgi:hypothetical protein